MASQYGGDIRYGIKFDVNKMDIQKTGLNEIKSSLQQIKTICDNLFIGINPQGLDIASNDIHEIIASVNTLEGAFNRAFNQQLGTLNIQKFNQELSKINLSKIQADMSKLGPAGTTAFRKMTTEILTTNMKLKESHSLLNKMADTFANTIRWSIASTAINTVTSSIGKAYNYTKDLDKSLNNIMIVTDKSADSMERFARQANKAAKELGASTTEYTNASLIYYQQGLNDAETAARTEVTLKAANVTKQSADVVSEQLTAVWNGYKVSAQETELYIDKLSAVAATTASDLEELSIGMSRVASAANLMGVDIDQLNAQLATIISVTREAPETIGTSLKTIFARMSDIEAGLDEETTLGEYTQGMADLGFNVLDANDKLRDMGDVIEEIGGKWTSLSREQQVSLAQTMAGTRQYSRLLALFDNWEMYEKSLSTSQNSLGTLQQQQDKYMQSMEAHLTKMSAAAEGLYDSLFNTESLNIIIDSLTGLLTLLDNFVQSIGGGGNLLFGAFMLLSNLLSTKIAQGISSFGNSIANAKQEASNLIEYQKLLNSLESTEEESIKKIVELKRSMIELNDVLTNDEKELLNQMLKQLDIQYAIIEQKQEEAQILKTRVSEQTGLNYGIDTDDTIIKTLERRQSIATSFSTTKAQKGLAIEHFPLLQLSDFHSQYENAAKEIALLRQEGLGLEQEKIDLNAEDKRLRDRIKYNEDSQIKHATDFKHPQYYENATQKIAEYTQALEANDQALEINQQALQTNTQALEFQDGLLRDTTGIETTIAQIKTFAQEIGFTGSELEEAINALVEYQNIIKGGGGGSADATRLFEKARTAISNFGNTAKTELGTTINLLKTHNSDVSNAEQNIENITQAYGRLIDTASKTQYIQNIVQLTTAFGQLGFALNSIVNMGTIISNENLSAFEKLTQLLMSAGMAMTTFSGVAKTLSTVLFTTSAAQAFLSKTMLGYNIVQKMVNTDEEAAVLVKTLIDSVTKKQVLSGTALAAAEQLQVASNGALTVSNGILSVSFGTLAGAVWAAMVPLLPYIAAIGAVVAVIGALVYAYKKAEENSPAGQLKAAEEQAKKSAEALQKVNDEISSINEQLENLRASTSSLKDLTVGTTEWYQELAKVQATVAELLERYPELSKYLVSENGIMTISESGYDYINQENAKISAAATGVSISDQINVLKKKQEVLQSYQSSDSWLGVESQMRVKAIMDYYNSSDAAKLLMSEGGQTANPEAFRKMQEELVNNLYGTLAEAQELYGEESGKDTYESYIENVGEWLEENSNRLKENSELLNQQNQLEQQRLENILTATGSQRTATQAEELGFKNYEDYVEKQKKQIKKDFDWNDHINYDLEGEDKDKADEIALFARIKGLDSDVKYVAQRMGDIAFEDSQGTEYRYSEDEFFNALAEYYASENFKDDFADKIKTNLSDVITSIELDKLEADDLINLDNISIKLQESLEGTNISANTILNKWAEVAEGDPEQIAEYADILNNINLDAETTRQIRALSKELNVRSISAEQFNNELLKIGTIDTLENRNSAFVDAAESMGMSEEDALAMQEYAIHLAETAETSELLSDELAVNANAAEDLAIEVTRMSKGVESLAENFEDLKDILKNSSKESKEYKEAMEEIRASMADIIDVEEDFLSDDFIIKNMEEIEKAAQGDGDAIDYLRNQMDEEILGRVKIDLNQEEINKIDDLNLKLQELANKDIEVGATLYDEEFLKAANNLVNTANMSADEANAYFAGIGYEPVYNETEIQDGLSMSLPQSKTGIAMTGIKWSEENFTIGDVETPIKVPEFEITTTSITEDPVNNQQPMKLTSFSGGDTPPEIKGLRKKATGSMNNYSSSNSGGKKLNGGGGSKKKPQKSNKKIDPFRTINSKIKQSENDLVKLEKEREKLSGGALLKNLTKQATILEEQKELQAEKLEIAKEEERKIRQEIQTAGEDGFIFDIQFDSEGNITNYDEIAQKELAALKTAEAKFNSSAQEDADQEAYDTAVERYEAFEELIEQYDEMHDETISDIEQSIQDLYDEIIALQVEKFRVDIDLGIKLTDAKIEWNDFKKELLYDENDLKENFELMFDNLTSIIDTSGAGMLQDTLNKMQEISKEIDIIRAGGESSIFGNNETLATETWEELYQQAMTYAESAQDFIESLEDAIEAAEEKIVDLQQQSIDSYERMINTYEHLISVKELLGGDDVDTTEYSQKMLTEQIAQLKELQAWLNDPKNKLDENLKETDLEKYIEDANAILDKQEEMQAAVQNAIETANVLFEKSLTNIVNNLEDSFTNNLSWDRLSTQWENDTKLAEVYLSSVNKEYEMQKLINKIEEDLLDTQYDSLYAQKMINQFKNEELNILLKKDKLTEAEVKRANQLYELTLLQIALEEARNNKSSMKLKRDSQGNYTYQYVADQEAIAKAEQELADKQNEIYNENIENITSTIESYKDAGQSLTEDLNDILEGEDVLRLRELQNRESLTDEDKQEMETLKQNLYNDIAEVVNTNGTLMNSFRDNTITAANNLFKDLGMENVDLNNLTEEQQKILAEEGLLDSLKFVLNSENISTEDLYDSVISQLDSAYDKDAANIDAIMAAYGVSSLDEYYSQDELIAKYTKETRDNLQVLISDLASDLSTLSEQLANDIPAIKKELEKLFGENGTFENEADKYIGNMASDLAEIKGELVKETTTPPPSNPTPPSNPSPTPSAPSTPQGNGSPEVGDTVTFVSGKYWSNSGLTGTSGSRGLGKSAKITQIVANGRVHIQAVGGAYGWVDISQISGYNTGGYTGQWFNGSKDGRLAWLHQKELILNEQDTPKILDAVKLVREMTTGSIISDMQKKMNNLISNLENDLIGTYVKIEAAVGSMNSNGQALEQQVHIDATFPNVKDAKEIEAALNNLVNVASQYATEDK